MDRPRGFTLIEAATCLVVASILMAVAVPAAGNALARTRAASARAALLATFSVAIGHAASTGTEVVLCPATGESCLDSFDWSDGWIAYADFDGNRRRAAGETLVHRAGALHGDVRLHSTKGRKRLVVQPNGGNAGSNVTFTLCDRRGIETRWCSPTTAASAAASRSGRRRGGAWRRCARGSPRP